MIERPADGLDEQARLCQNRFESQTLEELLCNERELRIKEKTLLDQIINFRIKFSDLIKKENDTNLKRSSIILIDTHNYSKRSGQLLEFSMKIARFFHKTIFKYLKIGECHIQQMTYISRLEGKRINKFYEKILSFHWRNPDFWPEQKNSPKNNKIVGIDYSERILLIWENYAIARDNKENMESYLNNYLLKQKEYLFLLEQFNKTEASKMYVYYNISSIFLLSKCQLRTIYAIKKEEALSPQIQALDIDVHFDSSVGISKLNRWLLEKWRCLSFRIIDWIQPISKKHCFSVKEVDVLSNFISSCFCHFYKKNDVISFFKKFYFSSKLEFNAIKIKYLFLIFLKKYLTPKEFEEAELDAIESDFKEKTNSVSFLGEGFILEVSKSF